MNLPEIVELDEDAIINALDPYDENSIRLYGAGIQTAGVKLAEGVLEHSKVKDVGVVGSSLMDLNKSMKGINFSNANPKKRRGIIDFILGKAQPFVRFLEQYESIATAIDDVELNLIKHRLALHEDAEYLAEVYEVLDVVIDQLTVHITVLEVVVEEGYAKVRDMTEPKEIRKTKNSLELMEMRLADLKVSRTAAMQNAIITDNLMSANRSTIQKIQSQIINGIPLWKQQIAIFITTYRLHSANEISKMVSDFQNETMLATSELLKNVSVESVRERNRTVIDLETIKKVNADIIEAIDLTVAEIEKGKVYREELSQELLKLETTLRNKVTS